MPEQQQCSCMSMRERGSGARWEIFAEQNIVGNILRHLQGPCDLVWQSHATWVVHVAESIRGNIGKHRKTLLCDTAKLHCKTHHVINQQQPACRTAVHSEGCNEGAANKLGWEQTQHWGAPSLRCVLHKPSSLAQ
jgi:hypothetical protein